jgi:hypothetical protein
MAVPVALLQEPLGAVLRVQPGEQVVQAERLQVPPGRAEAAERVELHSPRAVPITLITICASISNLGSLLAGRAGTRTRS